MAESLLKLYDRLILNRPWLTLLVMLAIVVGLGSQMGKIKIDASADSLMLRGDPALEFYRQVSRGYQTEEFLVITWQPGAPLLDDASLGPLAAMADELRALPGVSSVVTVLDVPLLESPPLPLRAITSGDPLPSLRDDDIDRELVLQELTTSPIYASLLTSPSGKVAAVQINLQRDDTYSDLLYQREDLRSLAEAGELDAAGLQQLAQVEADYKARTAQSLAGQAVLVQSVRDIADRYRDHAQLFVGGVPMIAADMVSFVRSDLNTFGLAILAIMVLVLAVIFRELRWVVIPVITCLSAAGTMLGLLAVLDWRMTVISSNFVALLLIISLAISIHLVVRYRELTRKDPQGEVHQRILNTVQLMVVPCFYTAVTTMVAFVSLVVSGIQPVIDFGWMMTLGIAVALVECFILVPCLIRIWPARVDTGADESEALTLRFARFADRHGLAILWCSLLLAGASAWGITRLEVENRFIDYFHESTEIYQGMELLDAQLGGTIPLDIILSAPQEDAPLPGLEVPPAVAADAPALAEDDPFAEEVDAFSEPDGAFSDAGDAFADGADPFADSEDPFAAADDPFADPAGDEWGDDAGFGGEGSAGSFKPSYWFTLAGMNQLDEVYTYLDQRPETGKVLSLSTVFAVVKDLMDGDVGSVELALVQRSLPEDIAAQLLNPYFDAEKDQARISLRVMETSKDLRRDAFLKELRRHFENELGFAPEQVHFTGMLVLYNNVLQSLFQSQILTLAAVFGAILLMFLLLFRSFSLALIALAPNILAAGLVLGVMGWAGIPLDIMTITIAAIVVGMGVDNCIHYVHRFMREFPTDRDYRATMFRCHGSIGRALYYTTVTVVIGFSTLVLSNFNPSIYFGLLTVLAMAAAVIGALLLLPRLIILFRPLGPENKAEAGV